MLSLPAFCKGSKVIPETRELRDGKMNQMVLIDCRLPVECRLKLKEHGLEPIALPPFGKIAAPVEAHPDMLVYRQGNALLVPAEYLDANRRLFSALDCEVRGVDASFGPVYPEDVRLNALAMGHTVYGLARGVCREIRENAPRFVPVRQGYTRCSAAVVAERAVITADAGLADALRRDGIDVLLIRPGYILLSGYDTGFIGGSGGLIRKGLYGFFGRIREHPQYDEMAGFAEAHGTSLISLCDGVLTDWGGLVSVPQSLSKTVSCVHGTA